MNRRSRQRLVTSCFMMYMLRFHFVIRYEKKAKHGEFCVFGVAANGLTV